jgi:hypothetical protein
LIGAFEKEMGQDRSVAVRNVLTFYQMKRDDIPPAGEEDKKRRIKAFETSCPSGCRLKVNDSLDKPHRVGYAFPRS